MVNGFLNVLQSKYLKFLNLNTNDFYQFAATDKLITLSIKKYTFFIFIIKVVMCIFSLT